MSAGTGAVRENRRGASDRKPRGRRSRPRGGPPKPLRLQPLFPLAQLVAASGLTKRTFLHFLRGAGIEPIRAGRFRYVPLAELEERLGSFVESIKLVERHHELEDLE